ncbi:CRISPR-associated protein Cas4 [Halovenus sp. HT40]|uniref:CRISPR-associated protein Cas4 n=1 Tax=Halovenus sp. HT40 TaxID=3126691 RepID=UPI00300F589A
MSDETRDQALANPIETTDHNNSGSLVDELIETVSAETFETWHCEREFARNIREGTPYFNGPASVKSPQRLSPSSLLQCHRKIAYKQLNAPEESADPEGIFWVGSKFETDIAVPFLRDAVVGDDEYITNSIWVDFTVETDEGELCIKGETDPVVVDADARPLLLTEIKTKRSIESVESSSRHHKAQAHAYLKGLSEKYERNITDAIILYGSRTTLDIRAFHIEFDPFFWRDVIAKWAATHNKYRLNETLPPADPEAEWECDFCSFRTRCGKADTAHEDIGPVGFIPGYAEYPREKVEEYLNSHEDAELTPTLAHCYPKLAGTFEVYDWQCARCETTYQWAKIEVTDDCDTPLCPSCLSEDTPAPLSGPPPAEQHNLTGGEHDE